MSEQGGFEPEAESNSPGRSSGALSPPLDQLLIELRSQQTQLEMQNDELRRTQAELQSAHNTYLDLFELAPIGYLVLSPRGQIASANLAASEMLKVSRGRLIGQSFPAFIDPVEAYRFHLHHQQVFEHVGSKHRLELHLRLPDGASREVILDATCFLAGGGLRLCRVALTDMTDRRRAERQLEEREARLAILNTVGDAVITIDDAGIIESVNQGTVRLFGYAEQDLLGQPIALLMPEPQRSRYRFLMKRYLDHGQECILGQTREVVGRRRDGEVFPAELTVGDLRFGGELRFVGVVRDVSDRKEQDRRVREALARFQEIADRVQDVFYIAVPSTGRVLYVSTAFERIFGRLLVDDDAAEPRSWLEWIHPDDRERVREAHARGRARQDFDEEYRIVRPDGTQRLVRDRGFPLRQEDRITGIVRDVTEERGLEQELRHAQRLEAVGTLASGIAHDFNNLLMGLGGLAKMALQTLPADHPAAGYVRRSLESTERGSTLTRQLLMFSGQRRAPAEAIELDAACRATRELLDRLVGEHIRVSMNTCAAGLGVLAEPGEIEQILLNLAANSRDAMPDGGEIRVETRALDDGSSVVLSVTDSGNGMDDATKARLFEPFFTTKSVGQGTGLGLSTVFAVARQRGGDVKVESTLGRGTAVTVKLPVVARNLTTPITGGGTPRGSETVLAVEDDALVRETIEADLRALGYTPVMVGHPDEALDALARAGAVDLLLTDVMMPGKLGGELAREIRQSSPGMRVLFMSAHPQSELLRLARIEPDDRLLGKPFGQHELGVALRAVLDQAASSPAAAPLVARSVLIVDDDPDVAEAERDALEQSGLAAKIARSGAEAIQIAGEMLPHLVLCDLNIGPGLSGYDVARSLRADPRLRDTRLVAITGLPADQCAAAATAAGFDEVLTKPIDLRMLERLAQSLLR